MIGSFPTPFPDELLYSVCARYAFRVQYPSLAAINLDLFGSKSLAAIIDLPCNLSRLDKNLPIGHSLHPKTLIYKNTLLGFYSPFIPPHRVKRILNEMEGRDGSVIHNLIGITTSTVQRPNWLRFCPSCVDEDRRQFGECYWHRVHQAPGVMVCPAHDVFLENSPVRARNRVIGIAYLSAEQVLTSLIPRSVDRTVSYQRILSTLARDVSWLLNQDELTLDFESIRTGYLNLLTERRLVFTGGRIKTGALIHVIRGAYPANLLDTLQCNFDERKSSNWPARILRDLSHNRVNHPLRHLLLFQALGHTAESFIELCRYTSRSLPKQIISFGSGPWPCLNPTCKHFLEFIITNFTILHTRPKSRPARGVFQCICGFTYIRKYTNSPSETAFHYDQIKCYGQVWEDSLRKLWEDTSISVNMASRQLGVAPITVKCQAIRLGLKFPRRGPSPKIMYREIKLKWRIGRAIHNSSPPKKSKQLYSYRRMWLKVREKYPEAGRNKLRRAIAPKIFYWLNIHDHTWLYAHMPPPYRQEGGVRQVDWCKRDIEFSKAVLQTALRLRNTQGIPTRVSTASIGRNLDRRSWLSNRQLKKLPITAKVLEEVVESRVMFTIRRVRWASNNFREEGVSPTLASLATRARISWDMRDLPEVQAAIDAEWTSLQDRRNAISIAAA